MPRARIPSPGAMMKCRHIMQAQSLLPPSHCCLPLPLPSAKAASAKRILPVLPAALPPVPQVTAVLVSPVCVGRSEVVGGVRRWRHRAAAASVDLLFAQATKRRRHVCHTRTMALESVLANDDLAQNVFCGPELAFSAGLLEGLGIVVSYWIWGLG